MKYPYLFFFKEAVIVEETFETVMLMWPKFFLKLCHSTVHSVNIHIIRPNDRKTHARCKVVGMDTGGLGAKHRKCFFHGREYTVLLF